MKNIVLLLLFTQSLIAQWTWQNPLPQGNTLNSVKFLNANIGFTVGENGTILKTTDQGTQWIQQKSGTSQTLKNVYFPDSNTGFIVGLNGIMLKSINGGISWNQISTGLTQDLSVTFFIDNMIGWIAGESGTILKTTNGGLNWITQSVGTTEWFNSIGFSDKDNGWIASNKSLLRTTNGGITWVKKSEKGFEATFLCDDFNGWGVSGNSFGKTTNSGFSWTTNTIGSYNDYIFLRSLFFIDALNGVCVGMRNQSGYIVKFTNGSISKSIFTKSEINSVWFIDKNNGWAVGVGGSILRTTDGGENWNELFNTSTNNIKNAFFLNQSFGFAIAENSQFLRTTNGGTNWIINDLNVPSGKSIYFVNQSIGWMASANGKIYSTNDGGITWNNQLSNTTYNLNSICFEDINTGWAAGANGTIVSTTNGGVTWILQDSYTNSELLSINKSIGTIWISGKSGNVLKSTNKGKNWILLGTGTTTNLNSIFAVDDNTAYAVGSNGIIIKTSSGGLFWNTLQSSITKQLNQVFFLDSNIGWIVGYTGTLLKTINAGSSWTSVDSETPNNLNNVYFADQGIGWVLGDLGTIKKYTTPVYRLTTSCTPIEGGSSSGDGSYMDNSSVTVKAIANLGYNFNRWTENGISVSTNSNFQFLINSNKELVANFSKITFNVSLTSNPTIGGNTNGGGLKPFGSIISITAIPNVGFRFVNWTESGAIVSTNNPLQLTINSSRNIEANFAKTTHTVLLTTNPIDAGNVTGGGTFDYGINLTITAIPKNTTEKKFVFKNWTENGVEISKNSVNSFTVTSDRTLVANFLDVTSVDENDDIPTKFSLSQNHPNPFNPVTKIKYSVPLTESQINVTLKIYDLLGTEIITLVNEVKSPGYYSIVFDGSHLTSGIYYYQINAGHFTQTKKLVLLK